MKKSARFVSKAMLLASVNILLRFVGVKFNAFISLKVGAECMGLFTLVSSVYGLCVAAATAGIGTAVVKAVSEVYALAEKFKDPNPTAKLKRTAYAGVLYSLVFSCFAASAVFIFAKFIGENILGDARTVTSIKAFALSLPAVSVGAALSGYFTGVGKVYKNAVVSVTEQFAKIIVISLGLELFLPDGIEWACLAIVGGGALAEGMSLVSSALMFVFDRSGRHFIGGGNTLEKKGEFKKVSRLALPIGIGSFARQGLITAEHVAIPKELGKYGLGKGEALASYGTLQGMVMPLILFPSAVVYAFAGLLVPELSGCSALNDTERVKRIAEKVFRAAILFSVCVGALFVCFSGEIGTGIYKSREAARQLGIMGALVPVMYLDSAVDGMLKGLGEQVYCMKVNLIDSVLCLFLVFVLVPKFGIDGYIALIMISECINFSLSICRLLTVSHVKFKIVKWALMPLLSALGAASFVSFSNVVTDGISLYAKCVFFIILYFIFCCLTGAVGNKSLFCSRDFGKVCSEKRKAQLRVSRIFGISAGKR